MADVCVSKRLSVHVRRIRLISDRYAFECIMQWFWSHWSVATYICIESTDERYRSIFDILCVCVYDVHCTSSLSLSVYGSPWVQAQQSMANHSFAIIVSVSTHKIHDAAINSLHFCTKPWTSWCTWWTLCIECIMRTASSSNSKLHGHYQCQCFIWQQHIDTVDFDGNDNDSSTFAFVKQLSISIRMIYRIGKKPEWRSDKSIKKASDAVIIRLVFEPIVC